MRWAGTFNDATYTRDRRNLNCSDSLSQASAQSRPDRVFLLLMSVSYAIVHEKVSLLSQHTSWFPWENWYLQLQEPFTRGRGCWHSMDIYFALKPSYSGPSYSGPSYTPDKTTNLDNRDLFFRHMDRWLLHQTHLSGNRFINFKNFINVSLIRRGRSDSKISRIPTRKASVLTTQICKQILLRTTGISVQISSKSAEVGRRPNWASFQPYPTIQEMRAPSASSAKN